MQERPNSAAPEADIEDDEPEATSIMDAGQRRMLQQAARQGSGAFRAAAKKIADEEENKRDTARPVLAASGEVPVVRIPAAAPVPVIEPPPALLPGDLMEPEPKVRPEPAVRNAPAAAARAVSSPAAFPWQGLLAFAALVAAVAFALGR
jgi:hypothetical protein